MAKRRLEDRDALKICGALPVHLNFLEDQYRPDEEPFETLRQEIEARDFEEVWIPAGIGGHRDHLLACAAALAATKGRQQRLYADLPYAIAAGWTDVAEGRIDTSSDRLDSSPFLPADMKPHVIRLTPGERARKRAAVFRYASQIPSLVTHFGRWTAPAESFGFELYWDLNSHERAVAPPGEPISILPRARDHRKATSVGGRTATSQFERRERVTSPDESGEPPLDVGTASADVPSSFTPMPSSYFDEQYQKNEDPWGYVERWYERRKRALTLAALPKEHYRRAFEPGCSIGLLTADLAVRCDQLLAVDLVDRAVEIARIRLAGRDNVEVQQMNVPERWPVGSFDLIVMSEIAYFLGDDSLAKLVETAIGSMEPDGHLVLVHYRPPHPNQRAGDEVHEVFRSRVDLDNVVAHQEPLFLLDVFQRIGLAQRASSTSDLGST